MTSQNPTQKNHVFIVSGGRTGTTFFGQHLQDVIDNCASIHEPDIFYGFSKRTLKSLKTFGVWHMLVGRYFKQTGVRNLAQHAASGHWNATKIKQAILSHRKKYYQSFPEDLIVEAYFQWALLLPYVHSVFPNAKSIGIVRDPRDWVRSWLNYGALYENSDPVKLAGQDRLTPALVGDHDAAKNWNRLDPFAKLCWNWAFTNQAIYNYAQTSEASRVYRFEDLFDPAKPDMDELVSFCATFEGQSYAATPQKLRDIPTANASKKRKQADWRKWTPQHAQTLDKYCGSLMRDLGYGYEEDWQALIAGHSIATAA